MTAADARAAVTAPMAGTADVPERHGVRRVLPWPPRQPRRLAGVPLGVLLCWELAAVLGLIAAARAPMEAAVFGGAAVVIVASTAWRYRRRWSSEWLVVWWRYRGRRRIARSARARRAAATRAADAHWGLLRSVAGAAVTTEVEVGNVSAAVVEHASGSCAVIELSGLSVDMLDLPVGLLPAVDPDAPEFALQLLLHVRPVPPADWAGGALLTVQALADPTYTRQQLRLALAGATARVLARLRGQGYAAQLVGTTRADAILRIAALLDVAPPDANAAAGEELWTRWRARGVTHETLVVRPSSRGAPVTDVVRAVLATIATGTTVTLSVRRAHWSCGYHGVAGTDDAVAAQLLVRMSEPDRKRLAASTRLLRRRLAPTGAAVQPMDGQQAIGLAATLPFGGFVA